MLPAAAGAHADEGFSRPGLHIERGFDAENSPRGNPSPKHVLTISINKAPSMALEIRLRTRPSASGCKFARRGLARLPGFHPVITDVYTIPDGTQHAELRLAVDAYASKDCRWVAADVGVRVSQPAIDGAAFGDTLDWKFGPQGETDAEVIAICARSAPARNARTLLACAFESPSHQVAELSRAGGRLSLRFSTGE